MNPQSAIQKGKELENWIVGRLKASGLDLRAARNPGSGNGKMKGDINNDLGWCIEAKNTRAFPGAGAFRQVREAAMGYQKELIVWHPPNTPLDASQVVMSWHDFEELLLKAREERVEAPDRDMRFALFKLKTAIGEVSRYLKP